MPSPVTPNDFKNLLNDLGGSVCEKFFNLMKRFPELVYQVILYERNEDGSISDKMKDDICSLACAGGSGQGGGNALAAPSGVSATDGTLGDRVRITWNFVTGATGYQVFRRDTSDSAGATHIGSPSVTEFDDTTAAADTIYYYWVKAVTATQTSAFSSPDTGYISTELAAVADLQASQGFYHLSTAGAIHLVWTPVTGATAYDIYRGTTSSFAAATIIDSDRTPFNNAEASGTGPSPTFVDNDGELLYLDLPPNHNAQFYYWVKAKRVTPTPATSPESNSALGWWYGWGDGFTAVGSAANLTTHNQTETVPVGATKAWLVLFGNGSTGAGGDQTYGGGGGGGGAVAWGELSVAAGGVVKLIFTPSTSGGNAAGGANGVAGSLSELQYQPPAGAFATKLSSAAGAGGQYSSTGNGAGGAGSVAAASGMTSSVLKDGRPGKPGVGSKGGRGGNRFGFTRIQGAHYNGFNAATTFAGNSAAGGGGSYASPGSVSLATGGSNIDAGSLGRAIVVFRA